MLFRSSKGVHYEKRPVKGTDGKPVAGLFNAWITLDNQAQFNSYTTDMVKATILAFRAASAARDVVAVVFTGAGDKAFVSGADISQFEDMRAAREAVARYEEMAETALMAIYNCQVPTLSCIRGYCIGGGVNVAISCDIRIASGDSVFSVPAARLGLGYRYSAMKNLVDLIGPGAAKDLFFTARRIDAAEAHALGLVTRVCAAEYLPGLLAEYTQALADNAPLTVRAGKAITAQILKPSPELDFDLCQRLIQGCFASEDYAEGRKAFMEKRKPVFRGK